ncbi:MAG: hypothetical protein AAB495_02205 [Patescibacteria group bacterium]
MFHLLLLGFLCALVALFWFCPGWAFPVIIATLLWLMVTSPSFRRRNTEKEIVIVLLR